MVSKVEAEHHGRKDMVKQYCSPPDSWKKRERV
jgi:hypothetical protein